jgi:hypothetical protein
MNIIESHLALDKFIVAPYVVRCLSVVTLVWALFSSGLVRH